MFARWKKKQKEHKENAFPGLSKVRQGTDLKDKTASLSILRSFTIALGCIQHLDISLGRNLRKHMKIQQK